MLIRILAQPLRLLHALILLLLALAVSHPVVERVLRHLAVNHDVMDVSDQAQPGLALAALAGLLPTTHDNDNRVSLVSGTHTQVRTAIRTHAPS